MRLKILLFISLFLVLPFWIIAQEQTEPADLESVQSKETRLFDEFSKTGECELGSRINNFFIELGNNSGARVYIIVYRGAEALPSAQTEKVFESQTKRINQQVDFLQLDKGRIQIIDGGFRKNSSIWNEVWIVPEGGIIPKPSETVEKLKTPTDKSFKVDEGYLENSDALIKKPEEIYEETESINEEVPEMTDESTELETSEVGNTAEQSQEVEEEFLEETPPFWWFSDYFAESLKENKEVQGVIIFYTDVEEYDIVKSRQIIEDGLLNLATKSKVDLSNVRIIFGGYRKENKVEYWIVPKGAKEPQPTPEEKKLEKTEEN
jgi:hypothetical protein